MYFRQVGDLKGEAKACANLSNCFKKIGKYTESVLCAKHQLEICRRFNDKVSSVAFVLSCLIPRFWFASPFYELGFNAESYEALRKTAVAP